MIVDANVLLYAVDEQSAFHAVARDWLTDALNGTMRVGIPWASLLAFQRIATHPRAAAQPLTAAQAWSHIDAWLGAEQAWTPEPGRRFAEILGGLVGGGDIRGNVVPDAYLAALALENGVGVCSFDSDFARFSEVTWIRPGG